MSDKQIQKTQNWAVTGGNKHLDLLEGFYIHETGALDAPIYAPSGHTVENDVTRYNLGVCVIGGLTFKG